MKNARQTAILSIIEHSDIETQEELANKLDVMLTDLCRSRVRAKEAAGMVRSRFDIRTMCRELETQYN